MNKPSDTILLYSDCRWEDIVNFAIRFRRRFPGTKISIDYARCPAVRD
jgi:hypothetical protein